MLDVSDLYVDHEGVRAVRGVSFTIRQGGLVGLVGANGAGKSSLVRALAGLDSPSHGTVVFDGRDVTGHPAHKIARAGLGLVPEGHRLFAEQSVLDNLRLGAYRHRTRDRRTPSMQRIFEIFPILHDRLEQRAGTLSGGEQQMLAIGRALLGEPRLLILDEPTLGLAPKTAASVIDAITGIHSAGLTILLVEQRLAAVLPIATEVMVLSRGALAYSGPSDSLDGTVVDQAYFGR